jgi:hypothetical protein
MSRLNPVKTVTDHDATPATNIAYNPVREDTAGPDETVGDVRNASSDPQRRRQVPHTPYVIYPALSRSHITVRGAEDQARFATTVGKLRITFVRVNPAPAAKRIKPARKMVYFVNMIIGFRK